MAGSDGKGLQEFSAGVGDPLNTLRPAVKRIQDYFLNQFIAIGHHKFAKNCLNFET